MFFMSIQFWNIILLVIPAITIDSEAESMLGGIFEDPVAAKPAPTSDLPPTPQPPTPQPRNQVNWLMISLGICFVKQGFSMFFLPKTNFSSPVFLDFNGFVGLCPFPPADHWRFQRRRWVNRYYLTVTCLANGWGRLKFDWVVTVVVQLGGDNWNSIGWWQLEFNWVVTIEFN